MSKTDQENNKSTESVWDYPRPPRLEASRRTIEIFHLGIPVAHSTRTLRVLETSHPPVYYIPKSDIDMTLLMPSTDSSYCEWKGLAHYYHLAFSEIHSSNAAWGYSRPNPEYARLADHLAFYASRVEECRVDGETVVAQPGDFYGGWITSEVRGPFKGAPGTRGW